MEPPQSPRGSQKSQEETARLKRISSADRLYLLRAWNEMDLHFKESSVDYLWLFYTAFYTAKGTDRKEQCYVSKLAIWKEKTSFSHEYLVATIKSVHDDNREHYLLFERTVGELNRDGVREEKLDGEGKWRKRTTTSTKREGIRNLSDGVIMPERLWEAHAFGGNAKRPENLSDEEDARNDAWMMTVKGLISGVSESSSANLILADDRYQLLDRPFRSENDVHIASLILKKPYEDDDDEEAPKGTTDNPIPKSPVATQEAHETEKPPSPNISEKNAHPPLEPVSDPSDSQSPLTQHHVSGGLQSSPQIQRHYSAESDSSLVLYRATSHLDYEASVLERASMSAPDLTEARLSPHLFASQLSSLEDTLDWESQHTESSFEDQSEQVSSASSSNSSGYSTPRNQSPSAVHETSELPYAGDVEDSPKTSGEYSNPPSPDIPHRSTSQLESLTPVHRNNRSLEQLSYVETVAQSKEAEPSNSNIDKNSRSLLFGTHEDAGQSHRPALKLKTLLDTDQSPVKASSHNDIPVIHNSREDESQLSPLEVDTPSTQQQHSPDAIAIDEISEIPRSPASHIPLGRIPSHTSHESKKSTSSRVPSVKSFFSIHSENLPPMPSRKYVFLFELIALANRLHKCKSLYRLFTKNCYWFVGIMFHVIRNFCQIDVSVDDKDGKTDIMKPDDEVTIWVNSGRMGRFLHAIKIMKAPRLFTIQALKRKWRAENARFIAQLRVNFAETTPEQLTVIQYAVDREKARRRRRSSREADIEKELEEERKRHAEELKKKEEEAEKREEEAKKREDEARTRYEEQLKKKEEEARVEERKRYEEEAKKREEEARKREEEARKRYEEEKKALLEELMRYREIESKKG